MTTTASSPKSGPSATRYPTTVRATGTAWDRAELELSPALRALDQQKRMLGQIFTRAQNKIQDPVKLATLIEFVDDFT